MTEELGKVEKPSVESFAGARKLIVVPLLFSGKDAPEDFMQIFNRCWNEISDQLSNLEGRLGKISRIYHEMVFDGGEKGMKILENLNLNSFQVVKSKIENGAELHAVEDVELATENIDWERCFMVAMGAKVRTKLSEFLQESSTRRYEHMAQEIDKTLNEGEIGLLFVREGHRTQFPQNIDVFNVYPPAMDEINRWLRNYAQQANQPSPGS